MSTGPFLQIGCNKMRAAVRTVPRWAILCVDDRQTEDDVTQTPQDKRGPDAIEDELRRTRLELADSIDTLTAQVAPANLAARAQRSVVSALHTPDGAWDPRKVAAVAGVAVILVVYLVRRRHA